MKKLLVLVLLLVLGVVGYTSYQHHQATGNWPWASKAEFQAYVKQTKQQSKQLAQQAKAKGNQLAKQAKAGGSQAWKWTTKNSQTLYAKSKTLLSKLGAPAQNAAAGQPVTAAAARAQATPSEDPLDKKSSNYKYGREWLLKGVAEWKVGLIQPGAARRAQKFLGKAVYSFEAAKQDLGGDPKVEEYLMESRTYLNDAAEMVAKIDAAEKAAAQSTTGTH